MKFAAVVLGATLLGTVAASAQGVELRVNPGGPDRVYVDRDRDVYRDRDRDWRDSRAYYRDRDVRRDRRPDRDRDYDRYDNRPGVVIGR